MTKINAEIVTRRWDVRNVRRQDWTEYTLPSLLLVKWRYHHYLRTPGLLVNAAMRKNTSTVSGARSQRNRWQKSATPRRFAS